MSSIVNFESRYGTCIRVAASRLRGLRLTGPAILVSFNTFGDSTFGDDLPNLSTTVAAMVSNSLELKLSTPASVRKL